MPLIQAIKIEKFPLVIITDTHTDIESIKKVQALYPGHQIICLGDITYMFTKGQNDANVASIAFFCESKIPCLQGNHDSFIGTEHQFRADLEYYNIPVAHKKFLGNLPLGFKLILPDGTHYFAFHNRPNDQWSHTEYQTLNERAFLDTYPTEAKTRGVIIGHQHVNYVRQYGDIQLIAVGQLNGSNHHTGASNGSNYALLTETGVEFKKLA